MSLDLIPSVSGLLSAENTHIIVESTLVLFIIFLLLQKQYKPKHKEKLTKAEVNQLIEEWDPDPLVPKLTEQMALDINAPVITSISGTEVEIEGKRLLNLISSSYLGLIESPAVINAAKQALNKYGCGSCGPRGFYGTIDIHVTLENMLAEFMKVDQAIVYSSAYAAVSSIIPCFSQRDDLIICDEGVHHAISTGLLLSRSKIVYFKHNDMADLRRVLEKNCPHEPFPKARRFLIVEGVYYNYADICPLPEIMKLKEEFCLRMLLDDSNGFGVLGSAGRGTLEHFEIEQSKVEITVVNMGNAVASSGGFCVGHHDVIDHQRMNGSGYVFSASLPPYLCASACASLKIIQDEPQRIGRLKRNAKLFRELLVGINGMSVEGDPLVPIIHLRLKNSSGNRLQDDKMLEEIVKKAQATGVAISRAKYGDEEAKLPPSSIRICFSSEHTKEKLQYASSVLHKAAASILG